MKSPLKRLAGLAVAGAILLIAFSGTARANFNGGDALADGSIDLYLNRETAGGGRPNVAGALPGDSGNTIYRLENKGKAAGELDISIPVIVNTAGVTGEFADGRGDLGANVEAAFYLDLDNDGEWSEGDIGLSTDGTVYLSETLVHNTLDNYGGAEWSDVVRIAPHSQVNLILFWCIPESAGNEIQGDSVSFDIRFTLAQAK